MDIERHKKLITSEIEAGDATGQVRNIIQIEKISKQDKYDITAERLKPTIDVQKSIDDKQDKMIEQLKKIKVNWKILYF